MTVSDNTIAAEALGDFLGILVKKDLVNQKKAKKTLKNSGRALEIGANVGTAFATQSSKTVFSSLPEVIKFYHTCEGLCLRKF